MKTFRTQRPVPFSPRQMFDLVADVDQYPRFLPLCEGMVVRSRQPQADGTEVLIADMTMGYKAIRETISSRVTLEPELPRVRVTYLSGPFSRMENEWTFTPTPAGCIVKFYIAYEVRNPLLGYLVSQVFDRAFKRFAAAFEARAHDVYGSRHGVSIGQVAPSRS
ncbi:MAG: SRPBCC family protein [Pseudomonadota bacterium]